MPYKYKKYIALVLSFAMLASFFIGTQVVAQGESIIPCDGGATDRCGFDDLIQLINNVIHFLLYYMVLPIATIVICYAGFLYLTSGSNPGKRTQANAMLWKLLIGLVVALAAWLIVKIILVTLGYDTGNGFPTVIEQ